jgi:hypothetical protein
MSFRMRRGRTSFSVGKRGPRASYRLGCLLPLAVALVLVASACGSAVAPTPSGQASPLAVASVVASLTPTATPIPTPTATPDPETLRKAAGTAYLAAAKAINKGFNALNKKYPTFKTLKIARAYYKAAAVLDGAFLAALKKITFPPDTVADAKALIRAIAGDQAIAIEGSAVKSWSQLASVAKTAEQRSRVGSAAANLVRSDLNLPPVPP